MKAREQENQAQKFVPNKKSEEFIKNVGEQKYISLFVAANGLGKCLPLDTKVLMSNGTYKEIKDVVVGDNVIGHDYDSGIAKPARVINYIDSGYKHVYEVEFRDGLKIKCSDNHEFPIRLRSGRKSAIKKRKLSEVINRKFSYIGGRIKFIQPELTYFESKKDKLPIDPYLLGVLLGDGCMRESHTLSFTSIDKSIIDRISGIIEKEGYSLSNNPNNITYGIVGYKKNKKGYGYNYFKDKLRKIGLWGRGSGDKFVPLIYKNSSVEDRLQLIAGLVDTDGTINEFTSKSKQLAEDFCFLIKSVGGFTTLNEKRIKYKGEYRTYYRVYWKINKVLPLCLKRKQYISKRPVDYTNRFVKNIKYVGVEKCVDIEVDCEKHCFLSGDFISTGNSCIGAMIITNICFGEQKFNVKKSRWEKRWGDAPESWFNYPLFKEYPYKNKRIRIVSDPTTIREKIVPELKKWFPSNRFSVHYETLKEGKNYECKIHTSTGFIIDLLTYEQQPKEFESVDCDVIWFDEPPPRNIFIASIARLRTGGQIMMTLTPLSYSAWIKDDLYDKQVEKNIGVVEASVWDNCYEYDGTRGYLLKDNIDNMIRQYPEDERLARIEGKFGHILGRVHKIFRRDVHVIKPFKITRDEYVLYMAHDTHPRVADAINWMAVDRKGQKYIIDELIIDGNDAEIAAAVKNREMSWRVDRRLLDPSGFNDDKRTNEQSFARRMQGLGLNYIPGSKDLLGGIRALDEAFDYEMKNGSMIKEPGIYIFETCSQTIRELENYVWDEYRGRGSDEKDPKPRPKDKNDHNVENLHRLAIEDFRWYPLGKEEADNTKDPYAVIQLI